MILETLPVKITRFNPTPSGNSLHIGHIYMILVNRDVAHSTGGKFNVRFDDNCLFWVNDIGQKRIDELVQQMKDELDWLGIEPDRYSSQQYDYPNIVEYSISKYGLEVISSEACEKPEMENIYYHRAKVHPFAKNVVEARGSAYPFAPQCTLGRVIMDNIDGINCLIRGKELITESGLYNYLCKVYDFPLVEQFYLSQLKTYTSVISTTAGNYNITDLRLMGNDPKYIIECLRESCLLDPDKLFLLENLKDDLLLGGV